jgi:hypothetical protein
MRWLTSLLLAFGAAVIGAFVFMEVGEVLYSFTYEFAPGFFPGCYPSLIYHNVPGFDAPRKMAWGDVLFSSSICGATCIGSVTLLIRGFHLGGAMSILRAYLIVFLSGIAGACFGGMVGYVMAVVLPGYYRGVFRAGGEVWFDPVQVGLGLGVTQGLLIGLALGAVVVLAVAWYRASASKIDSPEKSDHQAGIS